MTNNNVAYQLKPKIKHPCNYAKKAIQTWKDTFLSGMTSTHPDFPLSQWCKLVEQGNINLSILSATSLHHATFRWIYCHTYFYRSMGQH